MGKLILYIAASVDGYIATPDGGVGWLEPFDASGEDYGYEQFARSLGSIIVGGKTFRQVQGFDHWSMPDVETYVITRQGLTGSPGPSIHAYSGDAAALVGKLKAASGEDIWLMGGGEVIRLFHDERLIDEMMLFVMPVVLGDGIPLWLPAKEGTQRLALVESTSYPSGVVKLHYRRGTG